MEQSTETTENQPHENQPGAAANITRKFNLKFGYQDKENPELIHREVIIGKRPTGADFLKAVEGGNDDKAANTRINLALIVAAITKFGDLAMPTPMTTLLSLNEIDEERLNEEYLLFLVETQPETEQKILEGNRARLAFGVTRGAVKYQIIEFGKLLDGYNRLKIQNEAQSDWHFAALKIGREVVRLSTLDGAQSAPGELTFAEIEAMDLTDFLVIRGCEAQWLDSFRD